METAMHDLVWARKKKVYMNQEKAVIKIIDIFNCQQAEEQPRTENVLKIFGQLGNFHQ